MVAVQLAGCGAQDSKLVWKAMIGAARVGSAFRLSNKLEVYYNKGAAHLVCTYIPEIADLAWY